MIPRLMLVMLRRTIVRLIVDAAARHGAPPEFFDAAATMLDQVREELKRLRGAAPRKHVENTAADDIDEAHRRR